MAQVQLSKGGVPSSDRFVMESRTVILRTKIATNLLRPGSVRSDHVRGKVGDGRSGRSRARTMADEGNA